jgi:hypothetical protein
MLAQTEKNRIRIFDTVLLVYGDEVNYELFFGLPPLRFGGATGSGSDSGTRFTGLALVTTATSPSSTSGT